MPGRVSTAQTALRDSRFAPLWLDSPDRPAPREPLTADTTVDLLVVGGGFTGLWTALRAVERDPGTRVLLIEGDRIAEHATGRNGGFCEASLTHGEANGRVPLARGVRRPDRARHPEPRRHRGDVGRYGIDCGFARGGVLAVATRPHEVARPGARRTGLSGRRRGPRARRLADLPRGPPRARRLCRRRPGEAGLGSGRRGRGPGGPDRRGNPADRPAPRGPALRAVTSSGTVPRRTWPWPPTCSRRRCGAPGGRWCPSTTTCSPPSRSPRRSWPRSGGIRTSGSPTPGTSSTTTGSPLTAGSSGAATTRSTTSAAPSRSGTATAGDVRAARRALRGDLPAAGRDPVHPPVVGVIDTSTRFCAFYGTAHRGRRRTRWASPASGSAPPGSPPMSCSTSSAGPPPSGPGSRWCGSGRCRSRPSRWPGSGSS